MNASRTGSWAWLGHPLTVLALVVLVVNDHFLKAACPGPVTGKLSDAAGLVLAPPLVAPLFARFAPVKAAAAALALVGLGFTLAKSSAYGETVASTAWSLVNGPSVVRADRTDLLMLPFLAVSWWAWRTAGRVHPLRVALVLPVAVLGVAATSAPEYPSATTVLVDGTALVAVVHDAYHGERTTDDQWRRSTDGGLTWVQARADEPSRARAAKQACAGATCFRVVPGRLRVERSVDGGRTWTIDWQVSDRARAGMRRTYSAVADPAVDLSSRTVAVQQRPGGGYVVLVANGRDGFARRDPDGHWERRGYLATTTYAEALNDPESFTAGRLGDLVESLLVAVVLGLGVVSVAATAAAIRLGRSVLAGMLTTATVFAPIALLLPLMLLGPADTVFLLPLWGLAVAGVLLAAGVALGQSVRRAVRDSPDRRWAVTVTAAGLGTAFLAAAVAVGWIRDLIHQPATAAGLALVLSLPGVIAAVRAARLVEPVGPVGPI